jgi:hypothetical protein
VKLYEILQPDLTHGFPRAKIQEKPFTPGSHGLRGNQDNVEGRAGRRPSGASLRPVYRPKCIFPIYPVKRGFLEIYVTGF